MSYEITRTELVWPKKYDENGKRVEPPRVTLPFQVIERVNESRAARETKKAVGLTLFDAYEGEDGETFAEGWRNKLIWGDNALVMSSLLQQFAGKVDLVYIDPPFATGADFAFEVEVGANGEHIEKEQTAVEEKAYRDTWGRGLDSYLSMLYQRLCLMRDLLSPTGSIYVHMDATVGHYVKAMMDEVFGADSFQREIVWRIGWISGYKSVAKNWIRNHDTILFYVRARSQFTFNKTYVPYPQDYVRRGGEAPTGKGYPIEDVWNANPFEFALSGADSLDSIQIKSFSTEKTGYPTQKNESLLARIIQASSNPGDLVLDCFSGSGTTMVVAERLGRRWIGCDLGRFAIHTGRKRLLDLESCRPFEVLNLGKYERQFWRLTKFGEIGDDGNLSFLEYVAFILRLYGAVPLSGPSFLHGQRGKAFVHVGTVESPVTMQEIGDAVEECTGINGSELHVLGWEWEMGLNDTVTDLAKGKGVKLVLRQIPREVMEAQAAAKGDVTFYELAYLDVEVRLDAAPRAFVVQLKDFLVPDVDLIPDDVRKKIKTWADYVDYWAVDWDFSEDTFMQGWVTYRTRKDRTLALRSDPHVYDRPGEYSVMIKVIDIFGNDTSEIVKVRVK